MADPEVREEDGVQSGLRELEAAVLRGPIERAGPRVVLRNLVGKRDDRAHVVQEIRDQHRRVPERDGLAEIPEANRGSGT